MELRRERIDKVALTFFNDYEAKYDEVIVLKSLISKLHKDAHKTGFLKRFTTQEIDLIDYLHESLVENEKPKN